VMYFLLWKEIGGICGEVWERLEIMKPAKKTKVSVSFG
jgi:hypothetical protein